jgi:hypothetical protein
MEFRYRYPCAFALALAFGPWLRAQHSDDLHIVFPSRVQTFVKASYDPDDRDVPPFRGNDDGFSGINSCEAYRFDDHGTPVSVLAHFAGRPGVLGLFFRNFWSDPHGYPALPGDNNRTRMWVDGAVAYDMPLRTYFRNPNGRLRQIAPFDGPFTQNRAGGHLTHTQVRWNDSFVLGLDDDAYTNAARFHRVAATLASPEGELPMPAKADWERIAQRPGQWPHRYLRVPTTVSLAPAANGGRDHVDVPGPATLLEVSIAVADPSAWSDLWARFTWDGAAAPQVLLPLRHLGAMVEPPASFPVHSLLLDNDGALRARCWFPMPFLSNARLEVENRGPVPHKILLTHCALAGEPEAGFGYFVARHNRAITGTGEPFRGPRLDGCHGMLRGLILEDAADNSGRIPDMHMTHLEGDLCVRINNNRGDDHTFDASETSIGRWGWYITQADRPFVADTSFQSSVLLRSLPNSFIEGRRIMGSTFLFDPIHFVDGIDIVLEHGVQNSSNADYALSAFFYVAPGGAARRTIAEIDVGNTNPADPRGEPAHQVQFTAWSTYAQQGHFLRDQFFGTPALTGSVRHVRDYLRFLVRRPGDGQPHHGFAIGLRLDRLGGPTLGTCQAEVFVDGLPAGLLHVFTHNAVFPWKEGGECEVVLPLALTAGKATFTVELRPRPGSDPLAVERIWVHEFLAP